MAIVARQLSLDYGNHCGFSSIEESAIVEPQRGMDLKQASVCFVIAACVDFLVSDAVSITYNSVRILLIGQRRPSIYG
jgi:hypothetical protein